MAAMGPPPGSPRDYPNPGPSRPSRSYLKAQKCWSRLGLFLGEVTGLSLNGCLLAAPEASADHCLYTACACRVNVRAWDEC